MEKEYCFLYMLLCNQPCNKTNWYKLLFIVILWVECTQLGHSSRFTFAPQDRAKVSYVPLSIGTRAGAENP